MDFIIKNKIWFIALGILVLALIAYKAFAGNGSEKEVENSCPASFTIHPYGNVIANAVSVTYSMLGGKYFSQASGGYGGYSAQLAPKEISKDEFAKACNQYKSMSETV